LRRGIGRSAPEPLRCGTLALALEAIDVFGQRRMIELKSLLPAASLRSDAAPATVLPPRFAHPARLLFRWISADSAAPDEMNAHPATTPVCGWLLPNRLVLGFFLYDQDGAAIGSLHLNGEQDEVLFQSTGRAGRAGGGEVGGRIAVGAPAWRA
jgi:hypothetical protein